MQNIKLNPEGSLEKETNKKTKSALDVKKKPPLKKNKQMTTNNFSLLPLWVFLMFFALAQLLYEI